MANTLRAVITGTFEILLLLFSAQCARAQAALIQPEPYASIPSKGVEYTGPGREREYDLTGATISIGLIVPLSGARKREGEAIVAAARMALADAGKNWSPAGQKLMLKTGDESGPSWSGVTNALTRLVFDDQAIAIITSSSGSTAHLSEQVGNRIGVPVLTLASDKTTTQIDLPWIFRLGPTDVLEARTMAEEIYRHRNLERVLLVTEDNHDGRRGLREFEGASRSLAAPLPNSLVVDPSRADVDAFTEAIRALAPQALVLWINSPLAKTLIEAAQTSRLKVPIYLSQDDSRNVSGALEAAGGSEVREAGHADIWTTAAVRTGSQAQSDFARRYRQATGVDPGAAAAEAYDAVRLIAMAVGRTGPNRARVRDEIAKTKDWQGASGTISFDAEGNNPVQVRLVRVHVSAVTSELTRRD